MHFPRQFGMANDNDHGHCYISYLNTRFKNISQMMAEVMRTFLGSPDRGGQETTYKMM